MKETSLRSAFAKMAERHAADPSQQAVGFLLDALRGVVRDFRAEGMAVSLDVRPEHDGSRAVVGKNENGFNVPCANGTLAVDGVALEFLVGRYWSSHANLRISWAGEILFTGGVNRAEDGTCSYRAEPTYSYNGFDAETRKAVNGENLRDALCAVILHVMARKNFAAAYNDDVARLDKPAAARGPLGLKRDDNVPGS